MASFPPGISVNFPYFLHCIDWKFKLILLYSPHLDFPLISLTGELRIFFWKNPIIHQGWTSWATELLVFRKIERYLRPLFYVHHQWWWWWWWWTRFLVFTLGLIFVGIWYNVNVNCCLTDFSYKTSEDDCSKFLGLFKTLLFFLLFYWWFKLISLFWALNCVFDFYLVDDEHGKPWWCKQSSRNHGRLKTIPTNCHIVEMLTK